MPPHSKRLPGMWPGRTTGICATGIALLLLSACAAPAGPAVDWSLRGTTSARITADTNRGLSADEQEALLTMALDAGLVLDAETKRTLLSFNTGLSRVFFFGEGRPDSNAAQRIDPRFAVSGAYRGKTYTVSGNAGFDFQPTSFTQTDDTGIIDDETTQLTVSYANSLSLQLDELNALVIGTSAQVIDFTDDVEGLNATRTFGASLAWNRQISETTSISLSGGFRQFLSDADENDSQTLDISAGLTHQRTRRHSFSLGLGASAVRSTDSNQTSAGDDDLDLNMNGNFGFTYSANDALRAALTLSQGVDPSSTGELQSFTRFGGTIGYSLNDRQSLSLGTNYTRRAPISGDGETFQTFTLTPGYSLQLAPDVSLSTGYAFVLQSDDTDGFASGHRIFMQLSKGFDLKP